MEITPNNNVEPVARALASQAKARTPQPGADTATFDRATALKETLEATPLVRPEMVLAARQRIGDVRYPPEETIQRLAALLAMNLERDRNPTAEPKA
jgi:hypothetical protein